MGATFLEDEPFSVRFALKCKKDGTSDILSYKGTVRQKASIKAFDDTHQSKNFVRMINSCAKEGKPWRLATSLDITSLQTEGSFPHQQTVNARVAGPFLRNLSDKVGCDLSIDVKIALFQCGVDSSGSLNSTSLEIHIRDMKHVKGKWVGKLTEQMTWRPYVIESSFAAKQKQNIDGTLSMQVFPRSNIVNPISTDRSLNSPGLDYNIEDNNTKDFTLTGSDGIEVWCPKNLLRKCCEVFEILVSDDRWEEGRVNVYEFQKYTSPVLEAFVQYLYTSNTEAPSKHPGIAFDLLEMAHLYQYKDLECSMIAVLQGQPWIWYDIITAWNVLVFSTKRMNYSVRLMGYYRLQDKANEVIKMFLSTRFVAKHENRYGLRNREESPEMTAFKLEVERNKEFFASQFNIDPNTFL